jgi:rod shape determining protein RodA
MLNARWPQLLRALPWAIILTVAAIGGFGLVVLYSAAGGSITPWASSHGVRLAVLLVAMIGLSLIDLKLWLRLAYPFYAIVLAALLGVEALGAISGGSQRWLDLGIIRLQPSEFMKLAIILALARFYHRLPRGYAGHFAAIWPPLVMIALPAGLVMLQPDLGTAMMITAGGLVIMFLGGLPLRWVLIPGAAMAAALPVVFNLLHDYQRKRVLIFLDPESDPLGAGYHITQSKIAIGSGGLWGKGFLQGSQSHLEYLPEHQTDFVFATMAEEWGLAGGVGLMLAYGIVLMWGVRVALRAQTVFARLVALGLTMTLFFYVFINLSMVMGLAPVVGIPLPLVSFGGSAMMTVLIAIGILLALNRQKRESLA